jgi:iron complex outermembrane receptor protein
MGMFMHQKSKKVLNCFVAAWLVWLGGNAVYAADPAPQAYKIEPQSVSTALKAFAAQSNMQLIFTEADVGSAKTNGVSGTKAPREALAEILKGTGLKFEFTANNVVVVKKAVREAKSDPSSPADQNTREKEGKNSSSQDFLVAQVDQGTVGPQAVGNSDDQNSKKKKREEGLEEIVVTGSRIPTVAGNQVQPVRSYTREDIEVSGQTTIGDFLNTLPDVSYFTNSSIQLGVSGLQTVQLHGLPIGTTLTLLDGRRLEDNINGFFDLSNIPLAAVEKMEILPVGASAVYGADALGGAVNFILRKNFNGFEANASLDHASGVNNPSANLAWGKSWERGSISLIGTYQEFGELLGAQRAPTSSSSLPSSVPASAVPLLASYSCSPGNVYSVDGSNLPGLSSPFAAIPAGITGAPTIGQFTEAGGKQNICNGLRYSDITPHSQREGALLSAHYEVTESVDLFTEMLFSHKTLRAQIGPQVVAFQGFNGTVAANNPYNPFGEPVNASFAYDGTGEPEVQSTTFVRPMIGVRGSFLSDWHYEATVYVSRDQLHDVSSSTDYQLISNALASSNPATALNPFTSGAPGSSQLLNSLINPATDIFETSYDDRSVGGQVILRGPALRLPTGALQTVIGGEYSQERQHTVVTGSPSLLLQRNTYAFFSEARVPLVAGHQLAQGDERLALTLAGRYDHSTDYGGKATWQSGLLWRATDSFSLRGGYGLSYQEPQLSQISGPQAAYVSSFGLQIPDPFRGNQLISYPLTYASGPNPNLKPETGKSLTFGLEYSSEALPGLHTLLTWYDLRISNYIGMEAPGTILTYPNLFPGAVVRAPPSAQDQAQGFLGPITQFNSTYFNFGDLRVAGVDADVRYLIDTRLGQFTPSVSIANVYKWQSAILPNAPETDWVSQASAVYGGVGWSPRWKGTAALAWKEGPLSMNIAGRYIGHYLDYQTSVPNTNEIGNTWIFDFNARYELGRALASTNRWLAQSYISLGAVNLLNKIPPFSYTSYWYDIREYDVRGRYVYFNVGLRF